MIRRRITTAEIVGIAIDTVLTEHVHRRWPAVAVAAGLGMDMVVHPVLGLLRDAELAANRAVEVVRKKFR